MPEFSVGDRIVVVNVPVLRQIVGMQGVISQIGPFKFNDVSSETGKRCWRTDGGCDVFVSGDNGEEWALKFSEIRKLPPDDKQQGLPQWCRNLFDIEVDQPRPAAKPVNSSK